MSARGTPSSPHAPALRIIGATTSRPRSWARTAPTVVASSPVPSQALEITPVRTQRFNWMSCSRPRSSPAYSSTLASAPSVEAIAARSGVPSIVARNARTSAGSGFQSTYSGGSKAGKRFTASPSFQLLPEPGEQSPFVRQRQGLGELERRAVAVIGVRLHGPGEGLLEAPRELWADLAQRRRPPAQARDHRLLGVPPLERQRSGEHLERHDPQSVDVGASVERLAADLLGAHELRRPENDPGGRELRDGRIGAALLGEPEVHHHRALAPTVLRDEHDILGFQVAVHDLHVVGML